MQNISKDEQFGTKNESLKVGLLINAFLVNVKSVFCFNKNEQLHKSKEIILRKRSTF